MRRTRAALAACLLLAFLQFATACAAFQRTNADGSKRPSTPVEDAAAGAAVGGSIGGPEGAAIGTSVAVLFGLIVRWQERRQLRRRGLLIDRPGDPQRPIGV